MISLTLFIFFFSIFFLLIFIQIFSLMANICFSPKVEVGNII
ncbi:hypothetical protein X975_10814, partial [Stegodyphus mimosarum]